MVHTNLVSAAVARNAVSHRGSFHASEPPLAVFSSRRVMPGESVSEYGTMASGSGRVSGQQSLRVNTGGGSTGSGGSQPQRPLLAHRRRSSAHRSYMTFPTPPPKSPVEPPTRAPDFSSHSGSTFRDGDEEAATDADTEEGMDGSDMSDDDGLSTSPSQGGPTPLPMRQLVLLAVLSLAEQTALNSIAPYLWRMVASFPSHFPPEDETSLYVGLLASAFAMAQLATNLIWGTLSDRVGRKPVLVAGTSMLCACFAVFGLCDSYAKLMAVHVAMGLLNGNAAVVPTCLGELTDRSNQSGAFAYLPVVYSLGGITGPALGGLLAGRWSKHWPYLAPNLASAAVLAVAAIMVALWFEETLEGLDEGDGPTAAEWVAEKAKWLCCCCCGDLKRPKRRRMSSDWSARWPTASGQGNGVADGQIEAGSTTAPGVEDDHSGAYADDEEDELLDPQAQLVVGHDGAVEDAKPHDEPIRWRDLLNRTTTMLLLTYLVFQLSNVSFNSLYPIFASSPAPTGRDLSPGSIGISLSIAGLVTMFFQIFAFQPLKTRMGNLGMYRAAMLGLGLCMLTIPWVGYLDGDAPLGIGTAKAWLYAEVGAILIAKSIFAVGGLSSIMLLVCRRSCCLIPPALRVLSSTVPRPTPSALRLRTCLPISTSQFLSSWFHLVYSLLSRPSRDQSY